MTPGSVLFDESFKFKDGKTGNKLFIILNEGRDGTYFGVKTTSNGNRYSAIVGCNFKERYPFFYLPKGTCCLNENTWVQLDSVYEFEKPKLIQYVMNQKIKYIGTLEGSTAADLIQCISHSEDIEQWKIEKILSECTSLI